MKAKDIPPMQTALADLSPYFATFYDAVEAGIGYGKSYFEERNVSFDPWLHANVVRHSVKEFLNQHEMISQLDPEFLPNCGIQMNIKQWFIRMRKSAQGAVPMPGHSRKLQEYYRQFRQLFLPGEFSEMHNLLLLWNATPTGDLKGLSLVYPLSAGVMRWRAEIPHPAQSIQLTTTYQTAFDELGNLDIEPLEEESENEAEGQ